MMMMFILSSDMQTLAFGYFVDHIYDVQCLEL